MSTFGKPAGPLGSLVLLVGVVKSPATIVTERIFKDNHSVDSVTCLFPTFSLRPYTMEITGTFFFSWPSFFPFGSRTRGTRIYMWLLSHVALVLSVLLSVPGASSSQAPKYSNIGMGNGIKIGPAQRSAFSNFQKHFESDGKIFVPRSFLSWCVYNL